MFTQKYRRKEIYGQIKKDIGETLRKLFEQKDVEIMEAEACLNHIHMFGSILPHIRVSQLLDISRGKGR